MLKPRKMNKIFHIIIYYFHSSLPHSPRFASSSTSLNHFLPFCVANVNGCEKWSYGTRTPTTGTNAFAPLLKSVEDSLRKYVLLISIFQLFIPQTPVMDFSHLLPREMQKYSCPLAHHERIRILLTLLQNQSTGYDDGQIEDDYEDAEQRYENVVQAQDPRRHENVAQRCRFHVPADAVRHRRRQQLIIIIHRPGWIFSCVAICIGMCTRGMTKTTKTLQWRKDLRYKKRNDLPRNFNLDYEIV